MKRMLIGLVIGVVLTSGVIACSARTASADSTGPEDVRVQHVDATYPFMEGCLVFTHDTAQGASIAVACK